MNDVRWFLLLSLLLGACGSEGAATAVPAAPGPDSSEVDAHVDDIHEEEDVTPSEVTSDGAASPDDTGDTGGADSPLGPLDLTGSRIDSVISMPGSVGVQPAVAVGEDGQALVVFTATPGAEGDLAIYASFGGAEAVALKTDPPGQRNEPSVCSLGAGGFVAVWSYDGQAHGNPLGVEGAVLDGAGTLVTTFTVTTEVEGNHWLGHVGCDPAGGFVVVGSRTDTDDTTFGVFAQRYTPEGLPDGAPFGINPEPEGTQVQPVVTLGSGGAGVVVYEDAPADESYALTARTFDGTGATGTPFTILSQAGVDCLKPAVVVSASGTLAYAGNVGTKVRVLTAPSLQEPQPATTWLETSGSDGFPALAFVGESDLLAVALVENLTGAGEPKVRVELLGEEVEPSTAVALLGTDPALPPYPPAISYSAGTLAVAWTQRTADGYESHMSEFKGTARDR